MTGLDVRTQEAKRRTAFVDVAQRSAWRSGGFCEGGDRPLPKGEKPSEG